MAAKCMLCGKPIEKEPAKLVSEYDDEYDDDVSSGKKSSSFCVMCQAKLRNEADKGQKLSKPM
jgi:hypothetical protein